MKYTIPETKVWKHKYAWYPKRIGAFRIWLEPYSVRHVPSLEAFERYPQMFYSAHVGSWLEEFRYDERSYWRLSKFYMFGFSGPDRYWVYVKPVLRAITA